MYSFHYVILNPFFFFFNFTNGAVELIKGHFLKKNPEIQYR